MTSPVFILSTGRTGTQFFEHYINQTSGRALCLHEPRPSRRFKFLSNMYIEGRVSGERVIRQFTSCRRKVLQSIEAPQDFHSGPSGGDVKTGGHGKTYIESNNFIFGCIPALNQRYADIGVIHIVRHPATYVRSHLNHGFWKGHKRFFARYVPYWLEKTDVSDPSDPIELLSARWNMVNLRIASYAESNRYLRVRFEDLFSGNMTTAVAQVNLIREFCGLEQADEDETMNWINRPKNISKGTLELSGQQQAKILGLTRDVRPKFGYPDQS